MSNVSTMKVVTLVKDGKANEAAALINLQPIASATHMVADTLSLLSAHEGDRFKNALFREVSAA